MGAGRLGAVVLLLALIAGCAGTAVSPTTRRPAADPATAGAPPTVVVSNARIAVGTPSNTDAAMTPSPRPPERPSAASAVPTSWPAIPATTGQSAAARTLSQAAPDGGPRVTRGTLALPDPTQTAGPTVAAPTASPADAAATPSPSPSPVPTLRPAHPPARYPRLTTHGDRIVVRDRAPDPAGFYRADSLTPAPPGLLSAPLPEGAAATP